MSREKLLGDWNELLDDEFESPYFKVLMDYVKAAYKTQKVVPESKNIFRAFRETKHSDVKVIIISSNPYTSLDNNGIAFSTFSNKTPYFLL